MTLSKFYEHAYNWIIEYGPRFLIAILILFVGLWVINMFSRWSHNRMREKNVDPTVKPFLLSLLTVGLRVLLILGVMEIMNLHLTLLTALIGAFGVAAGLALSGTLQNFASGVLILLLKPYIVGDNIISQGNEGTVTEIQIFYTIVRTFDNRTVIIPNGKLSNDVIINTSREGNRRLDVLMKFSNGIDFKQVKDVMAATIAKSESYLKTPACRIGISELLPDGYIVCVNVWINAHGFYDAKMILQEALLEDIKAAGIKIAGL